ncbi:MAG: hypothetical protein KKE20_02855 [Nanoarchaeota archaeon]|nr:hypothetical protein [Nanoarchaeota archaeon]
MKKHTIFGVIIFIIIIVSIIALTAIQTYRKGGIDQETNCLKYHELCTCIGLLKKLESYPAKYVCKGIELCKDTAVITQCRLDKIAPKFAEIDECIIDIPIVYSTGSVVNNEADALNAANSYIEWSKENATSRLEGTDWEIWDVKIHGLYEGKKYWTITYSYLSEYSPERGNSQFDVNEDGEIRVFLGCI